MSAETTTVGTDVLYIVLTTRRPGSGLVIGGLSAVVAAERLRLRDGVGANGAFVAAYVRLGDVLVPVEVRTTGGGVAEGRQQFLVRVRLADQLLGQADFDLP